jgi:hypothetical protein
VVNDAIDADEIRKAPIKDHVAITGHATCPATNVIAPMTHARLFAQTFAFFENPIEYGDGIARSVVRDVVPDARQIRPAMARIAQPKHASGGLAKAMAAPLFDLVKKSAMFGRRSYLSKTTFFVVANTLLHRCPQPRQLLLLHRLVLGQL